MKRNFLSFDLGASSGRAIVGSLEDGKLELTEVHRFENGHIEADGHFMWNYPSLVEELKAGLKKALAFAPDICGIGIDTWGVDYVFFDADRKMLRLPYHYRDPRTNAAVEKVHGIIEKSELYKTNGIQFMPFNTIYQLSAHAEEHPEDLQNSVFLPMPDALAFALGGDFTAEYTHCSTFGLLDPEKRDWDFELIEKLGLPRSIFPEIVPPCTIGGDLSEELQKECGCGPIPIIKVGSHDTASAVAAVPAPADRDWAYLSCGTWALLGAEIKQPVMTAEGEKGPFTNEGGLDNTIRYLTNIMGSWLMQETRRCWKSIGISYTFGQMEDMAKSVKPFRYMINPNDLVFMAPGDMPGRVRQYCADHGQTGEMSDAEVLRCLYDSLALCFSAKLTELEKILGTKYQCFNIVGGGTKDHELMQCTADVMGIPVAAGPIEGTAIGNLIAQAIALGDLIDLKEARQVVADSFELIHYTPNAERRAECDEAMARYQAL